MNPVNMDDELKNALRREQAPEGLADRVLAQVAAKNRTKASAQRDPWLAMFTRPLVQWAAVAAVSVALVLGGIHYRRVQRERAEGEAAKQQLMLALHIAGNKLQLAKARVNDINAGQNRNSQVKE